MSLPLPFAWPHLLLFWGIYLWAFTPEFGVVRRATKGPDRPAEDRGSLRVLLIVSTFAMFAAFGLPFLFPRATLPGERLVWFVIGLCLIVAGSLLRRHCFRVLGSFFTGVVKIQADHRVVDAGAYRWVRHPAYSAGMLMTLGIALSFDNWAGAGVSLVLAFWAYSHRARIEEEALLASLGEPYARFLATRKRFVPFVC